jgi:hypothetical protein
MPSSLPPMASRCQFLPEPDAGNLSSSSVHGGHRRNKLGHPLKMDVGYFPRQVRSLPMALRSLPMAS